MNHYPQSLDTDATHGSLAPPLVHRSFSQHHATSDASEQAASSAHTSHEWI
ncbi:hypothetical protein [Halosegnis longus]|uniref:hypothetical protein n=1 Tax=Halosegnis longus TaxID=2216012 RepID=UPI001314BF6E